jgi:hypothetical protein
MLVDRDMEVMIYYEQKLKTPRRISQMQLHGLINKDLNLKVLMHGSEVIRAVSMELHRHRT